MSWFPTLISCSPNLTRVYIRLCKHGNHFTFLRYNNGWVLPIDFSSKRGRKTEQWDQEDQQWNKRFNRKKEYHRSKETVYCLFFFFCFACQWLFHMSNLWTFVHQNNIFKNTQRLEDLKSQMNWDQKALEAWLEESARKDEDALTLQKYTRSDEGKVKVRNHYMLSISTTTAI